MKQEDDRMRLPVRRVCLMFRWLVKSYDEMDSRLDKQGGAIGEIEL